MILLSIVTDIYERTVCRSSRQHMTHGVLIIIVEDSMQMDTLAAKNEAGRSRNALTVTAGCYRYTILRHV